MATVRYILTCVLLSPVSVLISTGSSDVLLTMRCFYEASVWQVQQHLQVMSKVSVTCQTPQGMKEGKAACFDVLSQSYKGSC